MGSCLVPPLNLNDVLPIATGSGLNGLMRSLISVVQLSESSETYMTMNDVSSSGETPYSRGARYMDSLRGSDSRFSIMSFHCLRRELSEGSHSRAMGGISRS